MIKKWLPLLMLTLFTLSLTGQNFFWSHAGAVTSDCASTLKDSLISVWEFDETSGTTATDSQGDNDGTVVGATVNQTGKISKAYDFDGTNDYVNIGDIPDVDFGGGNFSIAFWIYAHSISGASRQQIFSKDASGQRQFELCINYGLPGGLWAEGNICFVGYITSTTYFSRCTNTAPITENTWIHVVVERNGSNLYCYINGSQVDFTTELSGTDNRPINDIIATNSHLRIGSRQYSGYEEYFNGLLDQVAVYGRALTADEIVCMYNSGSGLAYSQWQGTGDTPPVEYADLDSCLDASLICEKTLNFTPVADEPFWTDGVGPTIAEDDNYIFIAFNNSLEEDYKYHTVWRYNKSTGDTASVTVTTTNSYYGDYHKAPSLMITSAGSLLVGIDQMRANYEHGAAMQIFRWEDVSDLSTYTDTTVVGNSTSERLSYLFLYEIDSTIIVEAKNNNTSYPTRRYYKSTDDGKTFGTITEYIDYGDADYWIYKVQVRNNLSAKDSVILAIMPSNHDYGYNIFQYVTYLKTDFKGNFYALDGTNLGASVSGSELESNYSWGNTAKNDSLFYPQGSKIFGNYVYMLGYIGKMPTSTVNVSQLQIAKVNVNTGAVTMGNRFATKFSSTDLLSTILFNMCGEMCAKINKSGTIYYYKVDDDLNGITLIHTESGNYSGYNATDEHNELTADYDSSTKKVRIFRFSDPDGL